MVNISRWSNSAAGNSSAAPDGFPEGMAPAGVNDAAREVMASIRRWYEDAEWIDDGKTKTYVAATQFKISGEDVTAAYHVGRRIRVVATTPGTIYGTISATAFSTDTTVTVAFDSGSLSNETLTVSYGIQSADNDSVLGANGFYAYGGQSITGATNTLLTLGTTDWDPLSDFSAGTYTPSVSGRYAFTANVTYESVSADATVITYIVKNGTPTTGTVLGYFTEAARTDAATDCSTSLSTAPVSMNGTTDYVRLYAWSFSPNPTTVTDSQEATYFGGWRLTGI